MIKGLISQLSLSRLILQFNGFRLRKATGDDRSGDLLVERINRDGHLGWKGYCN